MLEKKKSDDVSLEEDNPPAPTEKKPKPRILGTADYMAPEVILAQDVNYMLDFWSLGVIGYEFLTGNLPFNDDSPELIFKNIISKEIEWPPVGDEDGQVNATALDFLKKLIVRDQKERLGAKNGIQDIKDHPFFADVDWKNLIKEPVPWVPVGKDNDIGNFPKAATGVDTELAMIMEEESKPIVRLPQRPARSKVLLK